MVGNVSHKGLLLVCSVFLFFMHLISLLPSSATFFQGFVRVR